MFGWSVYADKSSKFIHSSLCVSLLCYFSSSFTVAAMCSRFFVLWYMKYHRIISWCDGTIMSGEWLRCFIVIFWKTKDGQTTKAPAKRRKFLNEFVGILVHSFQVGCYKKSWRSFLSWSGYLFWVASVFFCNPKITWWGCDRGCGGSMQCVAELLTNNSSWFSLNGAEWT